MVALIDEIFFTILVFFFCSGGLAELVEDFQVIRIVDGDTVYASLEGMPYMIRLVEIDAPEIGQPFGEVAKAYLGELLSGRIFSAELSGRDRYGRYLGRLYQSGLDINREMVNEGLAWVYDSYVTDKGLYGHQEIARKAGKGVWSVDDAVPPWEWRRMGFQNEDL